MLSLVFGSGGKQLKRLPSTALSHGFQVKNSNVKFRNRLSTVAGPGPIEALAPSKSRKRQRNLIANRLYRESSSVEEVTPKSTFTRRSKRTPFRRSSSAAERPAKLGEAFVGKDLSLVPTSPAYPQDRIARSSANRSVRGPDNVHLQFLGTGSMVPTKERNVSSCVLKLGSNVWVFDCGEGTQMQMQRAKVKNKLSRIFITHLHGDHIYGLPGVLSHVNGDGMDGKFLEIYGPVGIRRLVHTAMQISRTILNYRYCVYELADSQLQAARESSDPANWTLGEFEDKGACIPPRADGTWLLPSENRDTGSYQVYAARMKHSKDMLCLGYVVQENTLPGKVFPERLAPLLQSPEVKEYLLKQYGILEASKVFAYLHQGESVRLGPDTVVHPQDAVGPPLRGRKIVVLGDTCDARNIAALASGADLIVHESTNAYVPSFSSTSLTDNSRMGILKTSYQRGHSTPEMAGAFANATRARRLVLTHFSARYSKKLAAEDSLENDQIKLNEQNNSESCSLRDQFVALVREEFPDSDGEVIVAQDFLEIHIPNPKETAKSIEVLEAEAKESALLAVENAERFREMSANYEPVLAHPSS